MKDRIALAVALALLLLTSPTSAQKPERDVSGIRHPNIAAAQRLSRQAFDKIMEAQKANEWDMGGHAQKAKDPLDQVNAELKMAAEEANEHKH